ncbi:GntR family transcriptional regulator [Rhodoferax ferrireducens]|uniref:GntR family transcriptional regulator n=1 Tax=Rhodoferax ferrireducens TaxID=192843 RepID=UPI000059AD83|nr:GntR family transcriptional regulator [Rhodoferax ferrireducens]
MYDEFFTFMRDLFKSIAPCPCFSDEVADVRKDDIRDGRLVAGDKLPTEVSLIGRLGISRSLTTHRQVLAFIQTGHSALAGDPLA